MMSDISSIMWKKSIIDFKGFVNRMQTEFQLDCAINENW